MNKKEKSTTGKEEITIRGEKIRIRVYRNEDRLCYHGQFNIQSVEFVLNGNQVDNQKDGKERIEARMDNSNGDQRKKMR